MVTLGWWCAVRRLSVATHDVTAIDVSAKFDPAMTPHLEHIRPDPPTLAKAKGSPKAFARFVRLQNGQPDFTGTSRSGPILDHRINRPANTLIPLGSIHNHEADVPCAITRVIAEDSCDCVQAVTAPPAKNGLIVSILLGRHFGKKFVCVGGSRHHPVLQKEVVSAAGVQARDLRGVRL